MANHNIKNYGFGSPGRTKEFDDAAREKSKGPRKRKWTKEICTFQLEEIMDLLKKKIEDDDFKELQVIIDKMMDIIKYLHPPVQQNVNLNIDTTSNEVINRLQNWKNKKKIIIEND